MAVRQPRYSKEEFAQRGHALYETQIRPQVEVGNHGKNRCDLLTQHFVIDIETGFFEFANDIVGASDRILTKCPDAQSWFIRIGHPAVYYFGALRS